MATLENRIELIDGVSPTLSSIQRGAVDTTKALGGIAQARQGFDSLKTAVSDLKTALGLVAENRIGIRVDQLNTSGITNSIQGPVMQAVSALEQPLNSLQQKANAITIPSTIAGPATQAIKNLDIPLNNLKQKANTIAINGSMSSSALKAIKSLEEPLENIKQKASILISPITTPAMKAIKGLEAPLESLKRTASTVATGMLHPFKAMAEATAVVFTYPAKALGNALLENVPIARRTFDTINTMARNSGTVISNSIKNAYSGNNNSGSFFEVIEAKLNQSKNSASLLGRVLNSTFGQMTMANLAANAISRFAGVITSLPSMLMHVSDEYSGMQARLQLVVGAGGDVQAMNQAIYESAIRARGSYSQMADAVGKIAMTAKEAFPDPQEVVPFMEGIQKLFAIGGTDLSHQADALLQLTQALGSGKLQGDEFRSIAEAAPMIEQMVAKSLGVTQGALKQLSSDGEITAEVLKKAILENMDYINGMFEGIPLKWSDLWQIGMTQIYKAFSGVFKRVNDLANAPVVRIITQEAVNLVIGFGKALDVVMENIQWIAESPATKQFVEDVIAGFSEAANTVEWFVNMLSENWGYVEPLLVGLGIAITTFAAIWVESTAAAALGSLAHAAALVIQTGSIIATTFAQQGLNAALYACPLTWIIGMIIALVVVFYLAIAGINKLAGTSISATGIIFAVFAWVFTSIANLVVFVINRFIDFANFLGSVFQDPLSAIYNLFADIWNGVVELVGLAVNEVIKLIGQIPGIDKAAEMFGLTLGPVDVSGLRVARKTIDGFTPIEHMGYQSWTSNAGAAYTAGERLQNEGTSYLKELGEGVFGKGVPNEIKEKAEKDDDKDNNQNDDAGKETAGNTGRTADNTGKMADSLDIIEEEIKLMRDFANQEAIVRYTKQELAVTVGDINPTITQQQDIDGVIEQVTGYIMEGMNVGAEMVHA